MTPGNALIGQDKLICGNETAERVANLRAAAGRLLSGSTAS